MKTILLNGSPRRNWNTAQLLKSAQKGAESVGAETEYVDLYSLNFTGCRSCLACKRKGAIPCKCYWKDDLSPLIDRVFAADALIIGSPIYLSDTTSQFHAVAERLEFVALSYNDYSFLFKGKIKVGIVLTMNAPEDYYNQYLVPKLQDQFNLYERLCGSVEVLPVFDTLQVNDYSKYDMAAWDEKHKKERHDAQFPIDLQNAFELGAKLSR